jgi:type II secretory pathway component PulF
MTTAGTEERGTLDAATPHEARGALRRRGLFVLAVEPRSSSAAGRRYIGAADLALGLRILADLLESGLPAARALHAFADLAPRGWKPALPVIREQVREGKSLAAALTDAPIRIPPLVIGIIQAGEAGGGVASAVHRAAELSESVAEMRAAIRSALAYPLIVAVAGVCAIIVLITFVLPRFARILADLGQTLPPSTQLVLHGAAVAHALLLPASLAAVALGIAWKTWINTPAGRVSWHRMLLATPGIGPLRLRAATARLSHALAALLESGIAMNGALAHAARASGDGEVEARVLEARSLVVSGQTLSHALEQTNAVSRTAVRLARAGEESGRLASMLSHAARIEQKAVDETIRTAVRMLEPMLLLTFACVVALIAAALLQAIYSIRPA